MKWPIFLPIGIDILSGFILAAGPGWCIIQASLGGVLGGNLTPDWENAMKFDLNCYASPKEVPEVLVQWDGGDDVGCVLQIGNGLTISMSYDQLCQLKDEIGVAINDCKQLVERLRKPVASTAKSQDKK